MMDAQPDQLGSAVEDGELLLRLLGLQTADADQAGSGRFGCRIVQGLR